jgi:hypothetical protein
LGTQVAAQPLSVVMPALLVGNPYATLLTGAPTAEPVAVEPVAAGPFPAQVITASPADVVLAHQAEAVLAGPTRELVAAG